MTDFRLYALTGVAVFVIGLYGALVGPSLLRRILALNVMSAGVLLFLVAAATRAVPHGHGPDPVLHALVLTGIVVEVSVTALALTLAARLRSAGSAGDVEPSDGQVPRE